MRLLLFAATFAFACCCFTNSLRAERYQLAADDDWFSVLSGNDLKPGDEVILEAGVYRDARRLTLRHRGTAQQPIIIRANEAGTARFHRPDTNQNTFNLEGTRYLHLVGLEITGGSSAIRISPHDDIQPSDIVLERLHIHHIGGVAVTCNHEGGIYRRMRFHHNHIHHTHGHGEAFYLGGNNASAVFADSTVEHNYIHDLNGPGISQGDGIEVKQGSYGNRIFGNVIHDTRYPAITVYGSAGHDRNRIENNLIWNTGDHGIQVAADAVVQGNFIAHTGGCGIYSREHQGALPSNLLIRNNVIIAGSNPPIRITGSPPTSTASDANIRLEANHLLPEESARLVRIEQAAIAGTPVQWFSNAESDRRLPELPNHPAWKSLTREQLQRRFQTSPPSPFSDRSTNATE